MRRDGKVKNGPNVTLIEEKGKSDGTSPIKIKLAVMDQIQLMKKRINIALLAIGVLTTLLNSSYACSCIGKNSVKKDFSKSDVVFMGKVLSKTVFVIADSALPEGFIMKMQEYKILCSRLYKGEIKTDTISIKTGIGHGDCGLDFSVDEEYIVYARYSEKYFPRGQDVDKYLYSDICTRSRRVNKQELRRLKRLVPDTGRTIRVKE